MNYEIVWTDESQEGIAWVREEFEALWSHPGAFDLADAVIQDVVRLSRRVVIPDVPDWRSRNQGDAGAAAVELPVYRQENGLWAHQKSFVHRAFALHKTGGARLLLADQVGLGKTVQLALAAKLMTLYGGGRVLALVPGPLLSQWQDELWNLLRLPSAIWTGAAWVDERGVTHPLPLGKCPRRFGIVSTRLLVRSPQVVDTLADLRYECIILDEAHRAPQEPGTNPSERACPGEQPACRPASPGALHEQPASGHGNARPARSHRGLGPAAGTEHQLS